MMRKADLKSYLIFSSSPLLRVLKLSQKVPVLPSLVVYPTSRCNYHCQMCSVKDMQESAIRMDWALMEKLITDVEQMVIRPKIHFSGLGEPLVYSDFGRTIQLCAAKKLKWSLTTNAYLLEKYAEMLVENDCSGINISIHGNAELHNKIVDVKRAFEAAVAGIFKLEQAKNKLQTAHPRIAVNCVISNDNVLNLPEILDLFQQLPVNSVTFQHLIFSKTELKNRAEFLILEEEKINSLTDFVKGMKQTRLPLNVNFYPQIRPENIFDYYTNPAYPGRRDCILPWLSARVYPDGNVSMCESVWGNIKQEALVDIINNRQATLFRGAVRDGDFKSSLCFRCCHRRYDQV